VFFVFLSEVIVAAILFFLAVKLHGRYVERKQPAARYITFASLFLGFTASFQLLDLLVLDFYVGIHNLGLSLAYSMSAIANIFLYLFMLEIFYTGRKAGGVKLRIFAAVEAGIAVLLPIFGPYPTPISAIALFNLLLIVHLVFAMALYITLFRATSRSIKETHDELARRGFSFIRVSSISIIAAYVFFVIDELWTVLFEPEGYTYWVIAGWIAAGITGVLLYLGFVLPIRVRKRI
jgi:hypothetical protein